jgi:hypothetical protein
VVDHPRGLRDRDEQARRHLPQVGAGPAQQTFRPLQPALAIGLGLIDKPQLAPVDRVLQRTLKLQPPPAAAAGSRSADAAFGAAAPDRSCREAAC